ncbi:hypothetical protein HW932_02935 [Allochromatium humboldtianum]|uniref:Uncharacterized protein n=1 Tax=Allochromatium humboldtianum TaxID=504901 RepID=A0A850R3I9_9GAMM|nr:hypothetical protein [Allochromatium humboldtianum]NVZ08214.1 hypothetical protein [Allochromatium humboldtianum]
MKLGRQLDVRIIDYISDRKARVVDENNKNPGILLIKGKPNERKNGIIKAWVIQYDRNQGLYLYANAYFGKHDISQGLTERYVGILRKMFDHPEELIDTDISFLKGMCNRCLKKDQWDWFTTYKYLGYPVHPVLREFVADALVQRDKLRTGDYVGLPEFRRKYQFMLSSILFHLTEELEDENLYVDIPIPDFDQIQWKKMSYDSRRNLKIAERIFKKSSLFSLMHYFVTLEQEFDGHFIQPFIDLHRNKLSQTSCHDVRYQRTHDVLVGKSRLTLGAVNFLSAHIKSNNACAKSEAVRMFSDFLELKRDAFSELCSLIAETRVNGIPLPQLRNGLAHGDVDVTAHIDGAAFDNLRSCLLDPPVQIFSRILSNSFQDSVPANLDS